MPTDNPFHALNKLLTVVLYGLFPEVHPIANPDFIGGVNQLYGKYPGNHAAEISQRFFPDVVLDTSYGIQYTIGL
jgi:hypothetical protein